MINVHFSFFLFTIKSLLNMVELNNGVNCQQLYIKTSVETVTVKFTVSVRGFWVQTDFFGV